MAGDVKDSRAFCCVASTCSRCTQRRHELHASTKPILLRSEFIGSGVGLPIWGHAHFYPDSAAFYMRHHTIWLSSCAVHPQGMPASKLEISPTDGPSIPMYKGNNSSSSSTSTNNKQTNTQGSKQASKQENNQASKQASKQTKKTSKQASKQATTTNNQQPQQQQRTVMLLARAPKVWNPTEMSAQRAEITVFPQGCSVTPPGS